MNRKIIGIIPARYASTRFPGKPLILIRGKTMIQRVYEQACKARKLSDVIIATDDKRIFTHVKNWGGNIVMTSAKHPTGTDRLAEVVRKIKSGKPFAVINIQGDEPFIDPKEIDKLCTMFNDKNVQIGTLAMPLTSESDLGNPGIIKVVVDKNKRALFFSRSSLPFNRSGIPFEEAGYLQHIGIYAYRTDVLLKITRMKQSQLEKLESLEQLRWLQNGLEIHVGLTKKGSFSIDTPEDLLKIGSIEL